MQNNEFSLLNRIRVILFLHVCLFFAYFGFIIGFRLLRSDFDRNMENHKLQSMWYIHVEGTKAILG